jgi:hypothetical protein
MSFLDQLTAAKAARESTHTAIHTARQYPKRFTFDFDSEKLKVTFANFCIKQGFSISSMVNVILYNALVEAGEAAGIDAPALVSNTSVGRPAKLARPTRDLLQTTDDAKELARRKRIGGGENLPGLGEIHDLIQKSDSGVMPVGNIRFLTTDEVLAKFNAIPGKARFKFALYVDELGNCFDKEFSVWRDYDDRSGAWEPLRDHGFYIHAAVMAGKWYPPTQEDFRWEYVKLNKLIKGLVYDELGVMRAEYVSGEMTPELHFNQNRAVASAE